MPSRGQDCSSRAGMSGNLVAGHPCGVRQDRHLTGGQPELVRVTVLTPESDREAVTRLAAALEQHSEHPLAKAFLRLGLT